MIEALLIALLANASPVSASLPATAVPDPRAAGAPGAVQPDSLNPFRALAAAPIRGGT